MNRRFVVWFDDIREDDAGQPCLAGGSCARFGEDSYLPESESEAAAWEAYTRASWPGYGRHPTDRVRLTCEDADGNELWSAPPRWVSINWESAPVGWRAL